VAARVAIEHATLRTEGTELTTEPQRSIILSRSLTGSWELMQKPFNYLQRLILCEKLFAYLPIAQLFRFGLVDDFPVLTQSTTTRVDFL